MVPADFKGGALYISGGQVTNRLNTRGAVTREEVGNVLQGTVDVVEEVVRPGSLALQSQRPFSLLMLPFAALVCGVVATRPVPCEGAACKVFRKRGCREGDGRRFRWVCGPLFFSLYEVRTTVPTVYG